MLSVLLTKFLAVLKKYWSLAVIALLLVALWWLWRDHQRLTGRNDLLLHYADSAWNTVRYYRAKDGQRVAQVNTLELTVADLRALGERLGTDNHALRAQVGNLANLVSYYRGQASFHGEAVVQGHDTTATMPSDSTGARPTTPVPAVDAFWTNGHLYINTTFFPSTRKFVHDYSYDVGGFELTSYRKPTGFLGLGRGRPVTDVLFGDPNLQVTAFQAVVTKEAPPKFWNTRGFNVALGAVLGILLTHPHP